MAQPAQVGGGGSWQTSGWSGRTPTTRKKWLKGEMVKKPVTTGSI